MMLLPCSGLAACSMPQPTQYQYSQYQCGKSCWPSPMMPRPTWCSSLMPVSITKLGRIESPKETASYSDGVTTFSRQDKQATLVKSGVTQLTCELK